MAANRVVTVVMLAADGTQQTLNSRQLTVYPTQSNRGDSILDLDITACSLRSSCKRVDNRFACTHVCKSGRILATWRGLRVFCAGAGRFVSRGNRVRMLSTLAHLPGDQGKRSAR